MRADLGRVRRWTSVLCLITGATLTAAAAGATVPAPSRDRVVVQVSDPSRRVVLNAVRWSSDWRTVSMRAACTRGGCPLRVVVYRQIGARRYVTDDRRLQVGPAAQTLRLRAWPRSLTASASARPSVTMVM